MDNGLPTYDIYIDLNDEQTGLEANSGVLNPAHELLVTTFSGQNRTVKFTSDSLRKEIALSFNETMKFNDEDQTVYGVAIAADKPIYRNDGVEEYNVRFTPKAISDIIHDYSRKENFNKFNIEHNSEKLEDGVYMILSYQIDQAKGLTAPKRFENESDGTWILGYKIVNQDVYNMFKDGTIQGFSVEGTFIMDQFSAFSDQVKRLESVLDKLESVLKK